MMDSPPDGIIITISQGMLKEKGLRNWLRNFLDAMDKECTYWMRTGTKPVHVDHLMYVYLCIGGKIRYRCNFLGTWGPLTMTFNDGVTMYARAWIEMCGPVERPAEVIPWKGFRGFRYTQTLF